MKENQNSISYSPDDPSQPNQLAKERLSLPLIQKPSNLGFMPDPYNARL
jgi:hypothetical protein